MTTWIRLRHCPTFVVAMLQALVFSGCAQSGTAPPKLVVLIAVDGLRADLLDRYDTVFTGGLRRLRDEGAVFTDARVDHAVTVSHAGHVTLATGQYPSHHGIVDAAFYEMRDGRRVLVDAVADSTEFIPGEPPLPGVSPRRVLSTGISEWLVRADSASRTLAVGTGHISPLLYVFHRPADVYWYERGRYVTSSYYRSAVPDWVDRFNRSDLPDLMEQSKAWVNTVPDASRSLSRQDSADFEANGVFTTFPHAFEIELADGIRRNPQAALRTWFGLTPSVDAATLALARTGAREMLLGRRDAVDLLTIVLSMVDSNSHYYGPLSMETFDTLVRLDRELGEFFRFLDRTVGSDRYVVALSADHGFPEVPEYRSSEGLPARRIRADEIERLLGEIGTIAGDTTSTTGAVDRIIVDRLRREPYVADAYTSEELADEGDPSDPFLVLYRHSFRPDRIPRLPLFSLRTFESSIAEAGVMLRLTEGSMIDLDVVIHGSPYDYDRRVPLIFMGDGIPRGPRSDSVYTVDVAPTLARLAGIPVPGTVDGRPLF